ncbi:Ankyrin repeat protein [Madurella fahalii]|uniref:Ankyrin repeat protein n=1 Tax=Madurella fahalii TaxID=1157608 RepID=A0ABQ0GGF7_9PEZI
MPQHSPSTCLSDKPHDSRVSDPVTHYNGCLPAKKQRRFYESLPLEAQQRIMRVNEKILNLRRRLETTQYDSTAAARLRDFKQAMSQWSIATGRSHSSHTPHSDSWQSPDMPELGGAEDLVNSSIKAPVMVFKDGQPCDVPGLPKSFPDQKVTMADLLSADETRNPIMQPTEDNVIRYFHLPANNMVWVEEVIARYYHEKRPEPDDLFRKSKSQRPETKTEMLLRPEYWQGQQNFDADSEVHARHMRPFCSSISVDPVSSEPNPGNAVLFLPYLHWETDRGRAKCADIAKEVGKQTLSSISEVIDQAKHQLSHSETQDTVGPAWALHQSHLPAPDNVDKRNAVGQVLRTAAALLEAMDLHTEEQIMMKYLHAHPPLHPRRTLDQAYYGALRSTCTRDRDQVVYRGTTPQAHDCIGFGSCPQCNEDIRKTPRIIMVDQLWLWILDSKTVVTSFPRRWGRNKPDPSAIHKSLRMRLKYVRHGEITTAYDLALIIVDEASRVFFDRTKTNQTQPNLVELFNAAIRDLTYKQTAAFDQFLIYTHLASRDYKRQRFVSSDNASNQLLNINPEGELLKEVKDIMDELNIMLRIMEQQQAVMESFVNNCIRQAMAPLAHPKRPGMSQPSGSWDLAPKPPFDAANPYDDGLREMRRQSAKRTLSRADNLLLDLEERISELRALLQNAQSTSAALKDLLTLKQQQAGVIEAREAVKQAQLTLKQGQSIMIFTIVTIVFLPLSFCASLFGMNAIEFNDGLLPLSTELKLMFPISAGIILISFLFAFSQSVLTNSAVALARSVVSFAWNTAVTWVLVKTGLYVVGREMLVKANRLRDREGKITGAMKAEVLRREKNLERMRAAGHVRELAKSRSATRVGINREEDNISGSVLSGGGGVGTPYSASLPGSPSPFLMRGNNGSGRGKGMTVGLTEVDVELGERVSRKPSSQLHLVPGRH